MPEVSVLMGVYNTNKEQILRQSIDSILSQSFTDFEFIICDDGSIDNTYELLLSICKSDNRISLIRNGTNVGLAATLNRCIGLANGMYIARQDADDYSTPDRFAVQVDFLKKNIEYGFVGSNVGLFNEKGQWGEYRLKEFPEKKDFLFTVPILHGTIMYRKELFEMAGIYRIARETKRAEDYDLFMRMYSKGIKAANIQKNLYFVREDKNSYKRRKYRYRFDEALVKYKGFKVLGLMPGGLLYVLKPLIVGFIPFKLLDYFKDLFYKRKRTI